MHFNRFLYQWRGIILLLIGCASSLWLTSTEQLNLYIHPRYIVFTTIMAIVGLALGYTSFQNVSAETFVEDDNSKNSYRYIAFAVFVIIFATVALLVVQPKTLTSATALQRGMNSGVTTGAKLTNAVPLFGSSDFTNFTVKDWASLLAQTSDTSFFTGKTVEVTGFVYPDELDPQNIFYVSRFVLTCCAVDARPVGVPVYSPGWQTSHQVDEWVKVKGDFINNPSSKNQQTTIIKPVEITGIQQPEQPYVY